MVWYGDQDGDIYQVGVEVGVELWEKGGGDGEEMCRLCRVVAGGELGETLASETIVFLERDSGRVR